MFFAIDYYDECLEYGSEDPADATLYADWLEDRAARGETGVAGILRFDPRPRPWHTDWIVLD